MSKITNETLVRQNLMKSILEIGRCLINFCFDRVLSKFLYKNLTVKNDTVCVINFNQCLFSWISSVACHSVHVYMRMTSVFSAWLIVIRWVCHLPLDEISNFEFRCEKKLTIKPWRKETKILHILPTTFDMFLAVWTIIMHN